MGFALRCCGFSCCRSGIALGLRGVERVWGFFAVFLGVCCPVPKTGFGLEMCC